METTCGAIDSSTGQCPKSDLRSWISERTRLGGLGFSQFCDSGVGFCINDHHR